MYPVSRSVNYPDSDKLIALSDYFHVSLDYLMKADWREESGLSGEDTPKADQPRKQTALLAGVTICIASVIGLIWFGLVSFLLPDSHEQIGASSIITLNGTALLVLFLFGLLIVGVALIIRFLNKK